MQPGRADAHRLPPEGLRHATTVLEHASQVSAAYSNHVMLFYNVFVL